ncbi:MAG: hypothetical protein KJ601_05480, partial [Nanoarchaeota archaeon]|nr:hypothetical protein [Nanoarchaeota archaeon]
MAKKGQFQSQAFIYILGALIFVMILLYGYNAITGLNKQQGQAKEIELKTNLENTITALSSDYGSIKTKTFSVPSRYDELCFTSTTFRDELPPAFVSKYPIIADAVETGDNAFLIGKDFDAFQVEKLNLPNMVVCVPVVDGQIKLRIEGKGNSALISAIEEVAAKVNVPAGTTSEEIVLVSSDYGAELNITAGTQITYPTGAQETITVEKVSSPPSLGDLNVLGEVYDFGPDGTTFDEPIPITLTFDPTQVSDPEELKIYYFNGT